MLTNTTRPGRSSPPRILHLTSDLRIGGTETFILDLLRNTRAQPWVAEVALLSELDALVPELEGIGVGVTRFGMRSQRPNPAKLARLWYWVRSQRPALIQTWMYHADLIGGLLGPVVGAPVVWNVRTASLDQDAKATTRAVAKACAVASSYLPARIIVNSHVGETYHRRLGYAAERMTVIPNGVDTERFRPVEGARERLRAELDLPNDVQLVGHVGSYRPAKDHATFVAAATRILERSPRTMFVLAGRDVSESNAELADRLRKVGASSFRLLGVRSDLPALLPALDILVCSSRREGFPNVVAEGMACGVPCVVTAVGDAPRIVGSTGPVVEPGDPEALADACIELLSLPEERLGVLRHEIRARMRERFSRSTAVSQYVDVWSSLLPT